MSSTSTTATFVANFARRIPDPTVPHAERHVLFVRVLDVPEDLPKEPNPRAQKIDRLIYKDVARHLLNEEGTPNTFHLKNKGITLIADTVQRGSGNEHEYEVTFGPEHGIVDGGHTYEILRANKEAIEERNVSDSDGEAIDQFVKFEIVTGLTEELIPEIARGLNTAVQVQEMSLADLGDQFDWIKDTIKGESYADKIAFRENESRTYDARDVIMLLDLFNITTFPNDRDEYPTRAFSSKSQVLKGYLEDRKKGGATYEKLQPILKDILVLHDTISMEARDLHNAANQGKAGKLAFMETAARKKFDFPFLGVQGNHRLLRGALFPMLGAFRWMVEEDRDEVRWVGGFDNVLDLWREIGGELMKATQATSVELARNPNQVGKSRNHWANLHSTVAKYQLMAAR
jgi:AIPR protein